MFSYLKAVTKLVLGRGVRKSYGQFGEDAVIQALLKKQKGTYVDVGAYHPTLYSNTYALYKRGWRGLTIDPNKNMTRLHTLLRPRDTSITAAIGEIGTGTYYRYSDGAFNTFSTSDAEERKKNSYLKLLGTDEVSFRPLRDILGENKIKQIDFLNIDVEGKDFEVLQTHDWSIPTHVIAVEDDTFDIRNPAQSKTYTFLTDKGYTLVALAGVTLIWKKN
jgi:FkbM family methyltransferase